jgi:MFS transporter, ACS family, tartrate transporter
MTVTVSEPDAMPRQVLHRITWRLTPFLGLCYIAAYLDRINVSFAALHMNQDLHLSAAAYGTGAGKQLTAVTVTDWLPCHAFSWQGPA